MNGMQETIAKQLMHVDLSIVVSKDVFKIENYVYT